MTAQRRHREFRGLATGMGIIVAALLALARCSRPSGGEIDIETAVGTANGAVRAIMTHPSTFRPKRVQVGTERNEDAVNRCLDANSGDPHAQGIEIVNAVRRNIVGKRYYVVDYPVPPPGAYDGSEWEPCVFVDRETGEVLGVTVH